MKRWAAPLGVVLLVALVAWIGDRDRPDDNLAADPVDRVLIVSLPGVGWRDVEHTELPNLEAFIQTAAVGDMSTRVGRRDAGATDAYLTLGAGTRALAPSVDTAVAVDSDETYGGIPTMDILERRLGYVPRGIAYLASGAARDVNRDSEFGADVGLLGETLAEVDVERAVIANADAVEGLVSEEPPPDGYYVRSAATALMGSNGIVPDGTVGRSLLVDDPNAAFGSRLDAGKVLRAFERVWDGEGRRVVLVEASDLSRAAGYDIRATSAQGRDLHAAALSDADALLGRLLQRVDPTHDAVIVLSPVSPSASPALGMAALRAPGVDDGLLQSATTRRDGYVQLADVAPTVLSLVGEEAPDDIEGRSFQQGAGAEGDRVAELAAAAEAAELRDALLPVVVTTVIVALAVLALAAAGQRQLPARGRDALPWLAYGGLGLVPATFFAGRIEAARTDRVAYMLVVVGIAALVAILAGLADRYRRGWGAIGAVGAIVLVIGGDVLLGASLQLNTVFGYSVAVAGRFTGIGNLAYALFGAAAIVLASLLVERYGRDGLGLALAVLAAAALIDGLPMLGADVGGLVSMIPAFGVTWLVLLGRPIGSRAVVGLATLTAAAVLGFAFMDAIRPAQTQTHLARLADNVANGHWEPFFDNLTRRWQASFGSLELAGWLTIGMVMLAALVYAIVLARRRGGSRSWAWRGDRPTVAAVAGLTTLGTIGLMVNDSSFAVPAAMLIVAVPVVVVRTVETPRRPHLGWQP
jgi:hypothetical protein